MKPLYVERGGEQDYANPFALKNVAINSYVLPAQYAALEAMCDRDFNGVFRQAKKPRGFIPPSTWRVKPLTNKVLLVCAQAQRINTYPQGFVPEVDVAFWIPVLVYRDFGPVHIPFHIGFYQPYLFVDSSVAMATGRETYGYHKMIGTFDLPSDPSAPSDISVTTLGFDTYGPNQEGKMRELFRCRNVHPTGPGSTWNSIEEALEEIVELILGTTSPIWVPGVNALIRVMDLLNVNGVQQIFLKQFRSIENPQIADFQAINMAPASLEAFHSGGIVAGDFELDVHDLVSHPLRQEFGWPAGPIRSEAQFFASIDFNLTTGTTLARTA